MDSHRTGERRGAKADSGKSTGHAGMLRQSQQLQASLRELKRRTLTAQEGELRKISHGLRNEVAQTLLGVHVRLLVLEKEVRKSTQGFAKEIAATQKIVTQAARSMRLAGRRKAE